MLRFLQGATPGDNSGMQARLNEILAMVTAVDEKAAAAEQAGQDAQAAAAKAEATGQNARQMVLNRDPTTSALATKVGTLEEVAATVTSLNAASVADRADLRAKLDALTAASQTSATDRADLRALLNALALEVRTGTNLTAGTTALPTIALGASIDVTVTLRHALADATYRAIPVATGALIGGATLTVKSQTASSVVVTVKASVLVAAGQSLIVIAAG